MIVVNPQDLAENEVKKNAYIRQLRDRITANNEEAKKIDLEAGRNR